MIDVVQSLHSKSKSKVYFNTKKRKNNKKRKLEVKKPGKIARRKVRRIRRRKRDGYTKKETREGDDTRVKGESKHRPYSIEFIAGTAVDYR